MAPRQELPDWLQNQPFATFDHSLKRGRMSGPDIVPMFHGVRAMAGGPGDWRQLPADDALRVRCRALLRVTPDGTFFGGITAARLWGLPLPLDHLHDECLHTMLWYPGQPTNRAGVIGRQINDWNAHRIEIDGLPTIDLPTLFCHLGMLLSEPDLVAVGDAMILEPVIARAGPPRPLATIDALRKRVALYRVRGKRRAAHALERIRLGAESRPETLLRLLLVEAGFPEPELNVRLFDRFGAELARVDLLFREFRVIVEYDGDQHRTDTRQFDRDLGRLDDLAALGWRVVRVGARSLFRDPQDAVNRVQRALIDGGWVRA
ncbi:endonuclease domain-containing protein [Nakamurella sp.]|uniref:endonuclease domain-containing protein n=1 Tax=Nakamurella sp. TaxID=1869182 RepID=UPI0037834A21